MSYTMIEKVKKLITYCAAKYAWLLSLVLRFNVVRLNKERYTRKVVRRFYSDREDEVFATASWVS